MAKKIKEGDWVVLVPRRVVAAWDDGRVTIEVNGQRVTMDGDSPEIEEVLKEKERPRPSVHDKPD